MKEKGSVQPKNSSINEENEDRTYLTSFLNRQEKKFKDNEKIERLANKLENEEKWALFSVVKSEQIWSYQKEGNWEEVASCARTAGFSILGSESAEPSDLLSAADYFDIASSSSWILGKVSDAAVEAIFAAQAYIKFHDMLLKEGSNDWPEKWDGDLLKNRVALAIDRIGMLPAGSILLEIAPGVRLEETVRNVINYMISWHTIDETSNLSERRNGYSAIISANRYARILFETIGLKEEAKQYYLGEKEYKRREFKLEGNLVMRFLYWAWCVTSYYGTDRRRLLWSVLGAYVAFAILYLPTPFTTMPSWALISIPDLPMNETWVQKLGIALAVSFSQLFALISPIKFAPGNLMAGIIFTLERLIGYGWIGALLAAYRNISIRKS